MSLPEDIPPAERDFVELATRPLADDPATREAAQAELLEQLARVEPATRRNLLEETVGRLAKSSDKPRRRVMTWLAALWLLLAAIVAWQAFAFSREERAVGLEPRKFPFKIAEQTHEFSNPADLEDFLIKEGRMPADLHAIWTRIDPDNGAWAWQEAMWLAIKPAYEHQPSRLPYPTWKKEDFPKAWQLVEQAAQAPRFEWYFPERRAARQAAAGAGSSVLAIATQAFQNRRGEDQRAWAFISAELFAERVARLVQAGDKEGFKQTIRLWEKLIVRMGLEVGTHEDLEVVKSLAMAYGVFFEGAQELWPEADVNTLLHQGSPAAAAISVSSCTPEWLCGHSTGDSLWDWQGFLQDHSWIAPEAKRGYLAASLIIHDQPAADYEAGRLAEYAMSERLFSLGAATLLLLIAIPVALKASLRKRRIRALAEGLAPLLDKRDWLWLLGLGIVAPLAWHWGITRLSPWGGRELGGSGILVIVQCFATLLLGLAMIEQTLRWRVARATRVLGLSSRRPWLGWSIALLLALTVPLAGIFRSSLVHAYQEDRGGLLIIAGGVLLILLCKGFLMLLPFGRRPLFGAMLGRTALPLLITAAAVLSLTSAALLARERSLLARDPLTGWSASHGSTTYQAGLIEQVHRRCLELWNQGSLDQRRLDLPED